MIKVEKLKLLEKRKSKFFVVVSDISFEIVPNKTIVVFGEHGSGISQINKFLKKDKELKIENINNIDWNTNEKVLYIDFQKKVTELSISPKSLYNSLKRMFKGEKHQAFDELFGKEILKKEKVAFSNWNTNDARDVYCKVLTSFPFSSIFLLNVNAINDRSIANEIIKKVNKKAGIFITTRNLSSISLGTEVQIMFEGIVLESGTPSEIFYYPQHSYIWALITSLPKRDIEFVNTALGISHEVLSEVKGDPFASRSRFAMNEDYLTIGDKRFVSPTHWTRSRLIENEILEKINMPVEIKRRWVFFKSGDYEL